MSAIIGESSATERLKEQIARVARVGFNVLIEGESGTGKELVANSIHRLSARRERNFIDVNCAALPENLIEDELFGHMRGAFTGALQDKKGVFELAHGGILFLDEVAELPLHLQGKLLRVLQERTLRRVGGTNSIAVDVRVIAATNQDLRRLVKADKFPLKTCVATFGLSVAGFAPRHLNRWAYALPLLLLANAIYFVPPLDGSKRDTAWWKWFLGSFVIAGFFGWFMSSLER